MIEKLRLKQAMSKKNKTVFCPSCDHPLHVSSNVRLNQKFLCKECRTELEVVDLFPLTLDWAFDFEDTADDPYFDSEDDYYYGNGDGY